MAEVEKEYPKAGGRKDGRNDDLHNKTSRLRSVRHRP